MGIIREVSLFSTLGQKHYHMSKKSTPAPKYRDARTGEYVKKQYAEKHPNTTVKETSKPNKK